MSAVFLCLEKEGKMPQVTKEQIRRAKQPDLLTYLQAYEPQELVKVSSGVHCTREHDSLKISNGKWCWWSKGIGGRSALDYLIKVRGIAFTDAVLMLCDGRRAHRVPCPMDTEAKRKLIELPKAYVNNDRITRYLMNRGIDRSIIERCIADGLLYEDVRHNCVFIGLDGQTPKYAMLRGISSKTRFMGEVQGSDKRYSFSLNLNPKDTRLFLFESAIDLLSYISLEWVRGAQSNSNYLSLSGVYRPGKNAPHLPVSLERYLNKHRHIRDVVLCLDNDEAGRIATGAIRTLLSDSYVVQDMPPPNGKDYNDCLMAYQQLNQKSKARGAKGAPYYFKGDLVR